jgi:hypothetical protein
MEAEMCVQAMVSRKRAAEAAEEQPSERQRIRRPRSEVGIDEHNEKH